MESIRKEIMAWPEETAKLDKERILAQERPEGVTVDREHWYRKDRSPWHSYEIVRPVGKETGKGIVIEIHGGAWIYGNKELNENHTMYLSSKGWTAVSLSYGLVRNVTLFDTMKDIFRFLCHISKHREALGLDFSKVLLTGDSAGAHLSALTYALLQDEGMRKLYGIEETPDFSVTALGLSHPVMCLEPLGAMGDTPEKDKLISEEMLRMMTGLENYEESPIYGCMSFDDFAGKVTWPPLFIVTSRADGWRVNTNRSLAVLDSLKVPYTLQDFGWREDLGHVFHIGYWTMPEAKKANDSMLEWFKAL